MFTNFSYELKMILNESKKEMQNLKHSYIGTEHFILSILKTNNNLKIILNQYGLSYELFKNKVIEKVGIGDEKNSIFVFTPLFKSILEESIIISSDNKSDYVELETVFKTMLDIGEGVSYRIICEMGIDVDKLYDAINISIRKSKLSFLNDIGVNLIEKAKYNQVDIVIGRDKELENIIEILLRKNKKNPLLIGPAGVGKTAIVEGLANLIFHEDVPKKLINKKIISLSIASLVAGTKYRGEFEEKLLSIIKELENDDNYILFIDEIHTLMGAGGAEGAIDASNILKPALSRDKITIIGATTEEEYHKYIEDDKAFARRFQKVIINEPNKKELFTILDKVKTIYEKHHNVLINKNIIKYIMNVSNKYIKNRKEPDRSIDLLDEVSSMVSISLNIDEEHNKRLKNKLNKYKSIKDNLINNNRYEDALIYRKKERRLESLINNNEINKSNISIPKIVQKADINKLICKKYGIDLFACKDIKSVFKKHKFALIKECVKYKKEIFSLINDIKKLFIIESNIKKPISFLFIGNDINSKDIIIKKISECFFNNNIINIDLNEFSDEQSLSKIVGSPPGYIGYNNKQNVFEKLKEQPFNLIIFNNYEKTNIKIIDLINQILDKGYFNDSNGYRIDFLNSLIILNKDDKINNSIGFNKSYNNNYDGLYNRNIKIINFNKLEVSVI